MDSKRAVEILENCEKGLRQLAAEHLSSGDYATARQIMDMAESVRQISQDASAPAPATPVEASGSQPAAPSRRNREQYPLFFRRGNELVKVGWSKKERKEYNHRAPRQAVDALASVVRQLGARGRLFTSDDILPVKDPADGSEIPPYQAYLALAWLRNLGMVKQHGKRGGYSLVANGGFESTIAAAWPGLREWRG